MSVSGVRGRSPRMSFLRDRQKVVGARRLNLRPLAPECSTSLNMGNLAEDRTRIFTTSVQSRAPADQQGQGRRISRQRIDQEAAIARDIVLKASERSRDDAGLEQNSRLEVSLNHRTNTAASVFVAISFSITVCIRSRRSMIARISRLPIHFCNAGVKLSTVSAFILSQSS